MQISIIVFGRNNPNSSGAIELDVSPTDSIESVIEQIHVKEDIPPGQHTINFNGKRLEYSQTVQDCGIQPGSELQLLLRQAGC